jgi:alpha-ketoglutarate-dependent taurine dioxygenase
MALKIEPVDATFGAIVRGIKLTALDDSTWKELYDAWLKYALLFFPGQHLTREEQIAFARRFGPLEYDMIPISNVKPDGTLYTPEKDTEMFVILAATQNWHSDSTYQAVHAKGAVFCAEIIPPGGTQTGFADMRAGYDALDPAMKARLEGLSAYHSFYRKRAKVGRAISTKAAEEILQIGGEGAKGIYDGEARVRPIVKVHPETGRKSLLLGDHVVGIQGLPDSEAEQLVKELMDFACQPPRTYHYDWAPGDAVIWDNRCLLHRSMPWDVSLPRVMWHSRIAGNPATESALA